MLLQAFSNVLVVTGYELNKDYIARNLCVNRDKPKMHCNGCCHLKKELAQNEKQDQAPSNGNKKSETEIVIIQHRHQGVAFALTLVAVLHFEPRSLIPNDHTETVFQPPGFVA